MLGPLHLVVEGRPVELRATKLRTLLMALVVSANRVVTVDHLIDALWGERPPAGARSTVQGYVHRLRKVLEPTGMADRPRLQTGASGYSLTLAADEVDAVRFQRLAADGRRRLAGDPAAASEVLADALALWRGPALAEVADREFAQPEAARLDEARLAAIEDRIRAELILGHHAELVGELEALVRVNPRREHLTSSFMLALYRSGRQTEALRAYQRLRRHLGEAMGIEPSPELTALEEAILLHKPELRWVGEPRMAPRPRPGRADEPAVPAVPDRGRSPVLVGRHAERAALLQGLSSAAAGRPSVVIVRGVAGIGKTRLVAELVAEAERSGAVVLVGACSGLVDFQVPFGPLAEALRSHLALIGAFGQHELVDVSQGAILRVVPELAAATFDQDRLGAARLRGLLLRTLGWMARSAPLVLVLEDLHWADSSTAALVEFLGRNLTDQRILVVVTARTDELHPRHPRWPLLAELERSPLARRVDVGPLDHDEVVELARTILGRTADLGLVSGITARAGGNPLFVEELVTGIEEGTTLPSTLQEMLVARSAALGLAASTCVRVLAVAGRPLDHDVLARACALDGAELLDGLRAAVDHHLVIAEAHGYLLGHALVGEAHVADLLPGERADIHGRVAAALAGTGAAPAELAHHWLEAGDLAEALPALVAAAQAAERASARTEAVALYERAVALWDRVPDPAERTGTDLAGLFERAAEAALIADRTVHAGSSVRFRRAVELTEAALAHIDAAREPARAGVLHARIGAYLWHLGRNGGPRWERALRLLPAEGATAERAEALARYAEGMAGALRYKEAIPLADKAVELAQELGNPAIEGQARATLGSIIGSLGDVHAAQVQLKRAVELAEEADAGDDVVVAYNRLAAVLWANDRHAEGLALDPLISEAGRRYGLVEAVRPGQLVRTAMHLHRLGRWEECTALLAELDDDDAGVWVRLIGQTAIAAARGDEEGVEDGARRARKQDLSNEEASLLGEAEAQLALWLGRPAEALAAVDTALARLGTLDPAEYTATLWLHGIRAAADLADEARAQGNEQDATAAAARAAPLVEHLRGATAEPHLPRWVLAVAVTGEAEAARVRGDPDVARWREAAAAWEAIDRAYPQGWVQWRAAEALLLTGGSRQEAADRVRASMAIADQLRLGPLRARLHELVRRYRLEPELGADAPAT